ncbi:uncharacterized protein N7483_009344 [Penicillium malachiteum]|uniref:uncharacterized protein n=1 Tax=Penicillium malachiteum TaxID=1324776 RepID=UPI002548EDE0|nr:uncharacterized protein N7483_009344 [Penicillium malachiteum]KAJ5721410.1 hypothetical protein N7483_009344 [Penicillium malachiteum]
MGAELLLYLTLTFENLEDFGYNDDTTRVEGYAYKAKTFEKEHRTIAKRKVILGAVNNCAMDCRWQALLMATAISVMEEHGQATHVSLLSPRSIQRKIRSARKPLPE